VHTNDSAGAVTRLVDMGIEPFLVASSLTAILAQRLVRRVCADCRMPYQPTDVELREIGVRSSQQATSGRQQIYRAGGCRQCNGTGYRGRTGIYELIMIDESLRRLIHDRAGEPALRDACARAGVRTLGQDGTRWLADGTTSLAELLRVAGAAA